MKTKLAFIASTACLVLIAGAAYAADTSVPGGTMSTPGSEAKGNPISPPDKGDNGNSAQATTGQNSATATTPGEESKGKPSVQQ